MKKQEGFTLIELMIGITVGLIVITGASAFYVSNVIANLNSVKQAQFEQTAQALLGVMSDDIRRAGYAPPGQSSPFLTIGGVNIGSFYSTDTCILLTYLDPNNGNIQSYRGYTFANNSFYVLKNTTTAPTSCTFSDSAWDPDPVTDSTLIQVAVSNSVPASNTSGNVIFQADTSKPNLKWIHFTLTSMVLKTNANDPVTRDVAAAVALRN